MTTATHTTAHTVAPVPQPTPDPGWNYGSAAKLAGLFALYFLPTLTAGIRRHPSDSAIMMLNLLLGWTVLGWIAALVWAFISRWPSTASQRQGGQAVTIDAELNDVRAAQAAVLLSVNSVCETRKLIVPIQVRSRQRLDRLPVDMCDCHLPLPLLP
jgi:hypothetical protein